MEENLRKTFEDYFKFRIDHLKQRVAGGETVADVRLAEVEEMSRYFAQTLQKHEAGELAQFDTAREKFELAFGQTF